MRRPYKVIWWGSLEVEFDCSFPVWINGQRPRKISDMLVVSQYSFTAAVMAVSPEDAKRQIVESHGVEVVLEWQFVVAEYFGWSPFRNDRPRQPGSIWDQRPH